MNITKIKLKNFRNYEELNINDFSDKLNIIYGNNAQGKTNLLEAINICANGKSFRASSGFIKFNSQCAYINVEYLKNKKINNVEILINDNKQKSIKINGINKQYLKDLLGNIYVVSFCPEDIKMAKESPGLRRKFLDLEISKLRPVYVDALKNYSKIIAEKNAALRNFNNNKIDEIINVYNDQLVEYIKIILNNRKKYVEKICEYVKDIHKRISGQEENIDIRYMCTLDDKDILNSLNKNKQKEKDEKKCNYGPHRDDILIKIDDRDIKYYASQGQIRTAILSVKIACLKILKDTTKITPIFLMDDVFSELDFIRKTNLLKVIKNIQVFITIADLKEMNLNGKNYEIIKGNVKK